MGEILVDNSYTVEIPFCLGENIVDPDSDVDARHARILLNYSIDESGKVKLRGGRQKNSDRVPGERFISAMKYINKTTTPSTREYFFGTTSGKIYKYALTGGSMTLQTLANSLNTEKRLFDILYNAKLFICNGTTQEQYYNGSTWTSYTTPEQIKS